MAQQLSDTLSRRSGTLHREGIDDLGSGGGVFGVNAVEEGQSVAKERVGVLGGEEGVEAREGRVVGGRAQERQTDEPTQQQIGGQQPLQFGIATRVSPSAHELGAHELLDSVGGSGAFGATCMIIVGANGHDGSGVVELGKLDKRVVTTAQEDRTHQARFDPSKDGGQPGAEQILDQRRQIGQIGRGSAQDWWYNRHSNRLPVT